jgi:diaminohydroxyphosphoribosylaminopyrimidine deaminase/5-amino-6-(5-phosphoribosylamino)uracil reductase
MAGARSARHEAFMRRALTLARRGIGRTSPNPAVGAIIVKRGKVIGEGWHRKAGGPHAEIEAISAASATLSGSTLYVTLEPCSHFGRTPPCADAVIKAGIRTVVVGMPDPNPLVGGEGIRRLEAAGVEVVTGVLEGECRAINEAYIKHITTGTPLVTIKLASTLDGRIAVSSGESRWITGPEARKLVHRMRSASDAVMVGGATVVKDDPSLTVRHTRGADPLRVVVDTTFKSPLSSAVFNAGGTAGHTILFTTRAAPAAKVAKAREGGVDVVLLPKGTGGVSLKRVLKELGRRGVTSLLVEGGGRLAASFIGAGLADRLCLFMAPMLIGADGAASVGPLGLKRLSSAPGLEWERVRKIGADIVLEGRFRNRGRD